MCLIDDFFNLNQKILDMAYVVTPDCHKCKYTDCVAVCPVDCFYELETMLVINPDECIDCGACEPECPTGAIFEEDELPDKYKGIIEFNAVTSGALRPSNAAKNYSRARKIEGDNIIEQKEPLSGADDEAKKAYSVEQVLRYYGIS